MKLLYKTRLNLNAPPLVGVVSGALKLFISKFRAFSLLFRVMRAALDQTLVMSQFVLGQLDMLRLWMSTLIPELFRFGIYWKFFS